MSMDASVVCGLAHAAETFVSRFSRYSLEHLAGTNIDAKFQGLEGTTGAGSDVGRCRRGRVIMVGFAICASLKFKGGTGAREEKSQLQLALTALCQRLKGARCTR